jgi:hypothetical protein
MSRIHDIRNGLTALGEAIDALQSKPAPQPEILDRELSGNKINGGMITNFKSVGIVDEAKHVALTVHNDGITVKAMNVQDINNDLRVNGHLTVKGEIHASKLHVDEISADVRNERSTPLEFKAENGNISGKGLIWTGAVDYTKQFVFRDTPNRIWSSEDIDIDRDRVYRIEKLPVLTLTALGNSVTQSNLQKVGTLQGLSVEGRVNIDNFVFWDSDSQRLGIGTDSPNGLVSLKNIDHEFVIDNTEDKKFKIGTWTTSALQIITDDTTRIEISANGNISLNNKVTVESGLGVGVKNFTDDVSITTANGIRFQNKKFEVGAGIPVGGNYVKGDIIWNETPAPTGYIGWVCVRTGTPGEWKPFGQIQS